MAPRPCRIGESVQAHRQRAVAVVQQAGGEVGEGEAAGLDRALREGPRGGLGHGGDANRRRRGPDRRTRRVIVVTPSAHAVAVWVTSPERSWRGEGNLC